METCRTWPKKLDLSEEIQFGFVVAMGYNVLDDKYTGAAAERGIMPP
jgi:hypothetical protein